MLGLSRATLALEAKVHFQFVGRFESGRNTSPEIIAALQAALEEHGAVFRFENDIEWVGFRNPTVTFSHSVE